MKFTRFEVNGDSQLAVMAKRKWYFLKDIPALESVNDDLIKLLENWSENKSKIEDELAKDAIVAVPDVELLNTQLPFQPTSLRDFMLSEKHALRAARGFVKHFLPNKLPIIKLYEKILNKPFPLVKPKPIWYRQPLFYMSNHLNLASDGDEISWPSYSKMLDYELELAFVLVKPIRNANKQQALDAIGGFQILNDFSARDVQLEEMQSGFGPQKSKSFVNALSATLVSADEILPDIEHLSAEVRINDELVCKTNTSDMQHSIADILIHLSMDETLYPGEVFGLGTMPGGCAMENNHWLVAGDSIELRISKVGTLKNTIGTKRTDKANK